MMMVLGLFEIVFLIVTYFVIRTFLQQKEKALRIVYAFISLFFIYLTFYQMPELMINFHNEGTNVQNNSTGNAENLKNQ